MNNLATQYYIKALDSYPYDLEEALEALHYALSYDESHGAAHCLMGRFYAEQMMDHNQAVHHFELALVHDVYYTETYYHYAAILIQLGALEKALKLMKYAEKIEGICMIRLNHLKAIRLEKQNKLKRARELIKICLSNSTSNDEIEFLEKELNRIKKKIKKRK